MKQLNSTKYLHRKLEKFPCTGLNMLKVLLYKEDLERRVSRLDMRANAPFHIVNSNFECNLKCLN